MAADTLPLRIGLFGGTFDPPHVGHLVVADQVRAEAGLDEVWIVVANDPWQKRSRAVTSAPIRAAMASAAVGQTPGLMVSEIELETGGASYTIDTLERLHTRLPEVAWSVIVGADTAAELHTWHRATELAVLADFIVVDRPGNSSRPSDGFRCRYVDVPRLEISSTDLRQRIGDGRSVRFLTPDPVVRLIQDHGLYARRA